MDINESNKHITNEIYVYHNIHTLAVSISFFLSWLILHCLTSSYTYLVVLSFEWNKYSYERKYINYYIRQEHN